MQVDNPDPGIGEYVGYGVGAFGVVMAVGKMAWDRFFSKPGQAENTLYSSLNEQLQNCLARIEKMEGEIDDERRLRRQAQVRIALLEQELAKHGIEIPGAGS